MVRLSLICAVVILSFVGQARCETAEDFFRGKQMSLVVGYNPGGSYDVYSRLAATHLPRFLPGSPVIVAKNMPGVGSVKAANFLALPGEGLQKLMQDTLDPSADVIARAIAVSRE